jgi:hypothetical protein
MPTKQEDEAPKVVDPVEPVEPEPDFGPVTLTAAEFDEIERQANEAIRKEQHERLFKDALDAAKKRARRAAALAEDGSHGRPMVRLRIDLPRSMQAITTNFTAYYDGMEYTVSEPVAQDLQSRMFMAHQNERRIKGDYFDLESGRGVNIGGLKASAAISFKSSATRGHRPNIGG